MSTTLAWLIACAAVVATVHAVATFGSWAWAPGLIAVLYLVAGNVILYSWLGVDRPQEAGQRWWCCAWWPRYAVRAWRRR